VNFVGQTHKKSTQRRCCIDQLTHEGREKKVNNNNNNVVLPRPTHGVDAKCVSMFSSFYVRLD